MIATRKSCYIFSAFAAAMIAGGCASVPSANETGSAPSVGVLPGGGKTMAQFNTDDVACRGAAHARATDNTPLPVAMGLGSVEVASSRSRVTLRDRSEDTESTGSIFGNSPAIDPKMLTVQQRYDTAYVQCMYSRGHKIPVNGSVSG